MNLQVLVVLRRTMSPAPIIVAAAAVGIAGFSGIAAAQGQGALATSLLLVAAVAWLRAVWVPAIIIAGPGLLHVLTSLEAGPATRGDILASPARYMAVLAVLFVPPLLRASLDPKGFLRPTALGRASFARSFLAGVAALAILLVIRAPGSPAPLYAATKAVGFAAYALWPAVFIILALRRPQQSESVLRAVVVLGTIWLLVVLYVAASQGSLNLYRVGPGEFLGGTNEAGGGLGLRASAVGLSAFGLLLSGRDRRLGHAAAATLAVFMLLLTGHRGSVFSFLGGVLSTIAVGTWGARCDRRHRTLSSVTTAAAIAALSLGFWASWSVAPPSVVERYADPFGSQSFQGRLSVQAIALQAWFSASPLTQLVGFGTGASGYIIAGVDQPYFGALTGIYPHNVLIELLVETGVVGVALYLSTILALFRVAVRRVRTHRAPWLIASLVGLVTQALVASQAGADVAIDNSIWLYGALLAVALSEANGRPPSDGRSSPAPRLRTSPMKGSIGWWPS